ncbi:MAG: hypothetical protein GX804_04755 [Lentisphaerae bacterium]|jgi:hypothetical protein|nr:hypothetical protein [Lentisphaerota bacterium]
MNSILNSASWCNWKRGFSMLGLSLLMFLLSFIFGGCAKTVSEAPGKKEKMEDIYNHLGDTKDDIFERIRELQEAVRKKDVKRLAGMFHYPIIVYVEDKKTIIETSGQFSRNYSKIVTPEISKEILNFEMHELFVNWRGAMMLQGAVWVQPEKLLSFNFWYLHKNSIDHLEYLEPQGREIIKPESDERTTELIKSLIQERHLELDEHAHFSHYIADVNNDGLKDILLIVHSIGSARFSSIVGVWNRDDNEKFMRLPIERDFADLKGIAEADFSWIQAQSHLAVPFLVKAHGLTYFGFHEESPEYYLWKDDKIVEANPLITPVEE